MSSNTTMNAQDSVNTETGLLRLIFGEFLNEILSDNPRIKRVDWVNASLEMTL